MDRLTNEERVALLDLAHHPRRPHWGMFALAVALVCLSFSGIRIVGVLTDTKARTYSNQQAIRVSCTLLVNAIVQSGSGSRREANNQSPQQTLNGLYISVIMRHMTPEERRTQKKLLKETGGPGGGQVEVPDCDRISRNPEAVTVLK